MIKILQSLKDFVDLEMNYLFLSFRIKRREIKNLLIVNAISYFKRNHQ